MPVERREAGIGCFWRGNGGFTCSVIGRPGRFGNTLVFNRQTRGEVPSTWFLRKERHSEVDRENPQRRAALTSAACGRTTPRCGSPLFLQLVARSQTAASKIIELARAGKTHPVVLREMAMSELSIPRLAKSEN
jgi:hypothetical protein